MARCAIPLINKLFGLTIEYNQLKDIDNDIQKTIERRPDVLKLVDFKNKKENYLLHIEFQTKNETDMNVRMLEYYAMLFHKYNVSIKQYVVYIGEAKLNMADFVKYDKINFSFDIINLSETDYQDFLTSDVPEFVLLGILANFGKDNPKQAISNLLQKIITITNTQPRYKDTLEQEKFIQQIEIISKLRNFQNLIVQKLKDMALILDITTDLRYIEGQAQKEKEMLEIIEKIQKEKEEILANAQKEKEQQLEKIQKEKAKKIENIKKAHTKGMNITDIADIFGVSVTEINKILR